MTTYFVDPEHGSDIKGNGKTPDTAFATIWRATGGSWIMAVFNKVYNLMKHWIKEEKLNDH